MADPASKKPPRAVPAATPLTPATPREPAAPAVPATSPTAAAKREDISRWEGEGGAPSQGSQGRSKDGSGTGKAPPPRKR